jgi:O-antigen/teichoic acid export membrane protein
LKAVLRVPDGYMREVVAGASSAFVIKVIAAVSGLGLSIALARTIGAEGAGVYYLAFTITTVAATVARLGLDNVVVRLVAGGRAEGAWGRVRAAHRKALLLAAAASGSIAVLAYAAGPWLAAGVFHKPELAGSLRWMSLAIVPIALATLYAQSLQGLKRIRPAMAVLSLWTPLLTLAAVPVLAVNLGVEGASLALLAGSSGTLLIGYLHWSAATRAEPRAAAPAPPAAEMLHRSIPLLWVALLNATYRWAPTLLLGLWVESAAVGVYAVAQRAAFLTAFVLLAVNSIVAPMFAEFHQKGDFVNLERIARHSARLMALFALPFAVPMVFAPGFVMALFGEEFRGGSMVLVLLALGQYVNVATGSVGYLLMMTGHERLIRNVTFAAAATSLAISVMLIPRLGITGAAIGTSLGMAAQNVAAAVLVYRKLGIATVPLLGRVGKRSAAP